MRLAAATVWVMLPVIAGTGLYLLKMRVEAQEQRLVGLQKQIVDTREAIHVLKAEWSYLNDPVRLRDEADRLLAMRPIQPNQIVTIDRIPFPDPAPVAAAPELGGAPAPVAGPLASAETQSDPIGAAITALADPPRRKHR